MRILLSLLLVAITTVSNASSIDTNEIVTLDGYRHFVSYKGMEDKPVLLILHGGPGRTLRGAADYFNDKLIQEFIVVHWDQRRTEMGDSLNPNQQELTMELLHADTELMVDYLRKRFQQERIFLASHSWGSETGFEFAHKHPEKLHAFIAISPMIDQVKTTQLTIALLKDWAIENTDSTALQELDSVKIPHETKSDLFYQQKWLFIHNEVGFASLPNFRDVYFEWMDVWFPLIREQSQQSLIERYQSFQCPIVILEGNGDGMEVHQLAKEFYKHIKSKGKRFVWFKESGHTVFNTEPEKLQDEIIKVSKRFSK